MSRHTLTPELAKAQFENQVNRAAKAIRLIAKTVEENPAHFEALTIVKTDFYLANQVSAAIGDMQTALRAADPARAPFSLDAEYVPAQLSSVREPSIAPAITPSERTSAAAPPAPPPAPPPGTARRRAIGRLPSVDGKKGEIIFAIVDPAVRPTLREDPLEKPDRTGAIREAGFIDD